MHDLIIYPYEKQNEYIYQERDNLINEDHIKYDENDEVNRNGISYKINIYDNNNNNNNNNNVDDNNNNNVDDNNNHNNDHNSDKDNIASQFIHTCIKENIIDDTKYDSFQKREDITNIKKNSLDFNTINEKIFNINIKIKEPKVKTTNNTHVDYNDDNNDDSNISIRTNPKHTSHHNDTSDDSSYSSIDDIKHILKKSKIKNLQQNKKKYICNYISQHKKRIKEKKSNLIKKKKINKQNNYLTTNFLKINQKTKENIKRASAASIILENNFNSDHIDEDEQNSSYDENLNYHTNDF
ncbi:conserved Plasmodium protein, unknown function [Plasmodium reichenowi]|uniref:Uncharacterized protein n=1 Tax=Plasmodium reichenowi TaxID=5854 RepID=A0A060S070_PLARE|nr:conserved Plasmodium protein, unknown function [Plasmodium reichenowi]